MLVAVGLFVNNDAEHGGTQLLDFANRMAGHESEYTLVIVARIRESYTPWLQIYGFSEIVDNNSIHVYDQIEPDGEWHIIQISCADLGAMKAEYLYDSRTDDGNGHTLIPGYKANLYSYGTGYGLAEVCAVWYAKY